MRWKASNLHARQMAALVALLMLPLTPPAAAADEDRAAPDAVGKHVGLAGLPDFIDGIVAQQIASRELAGAVIVIVHHGKVAFSRGYGFADIEHAIQIDAERTRFRPGSVSKLFTWSALMQQVELGQVDLDADVNRYLDFAIPPFEHEPIKVRHLLAHAPGMGDLAYEGEDWSRDEPYQAFLKTHVPQRLWAPGKEISYSNYGAALAGYIVERTSGEPFADYVDRHIFKPLGMASSAFREPLSGENAQHMAKGYALVDGRFDAKPYERFGKIMPAGSAAVTAPDMARFMLALLGHGPKDKECILSPRSIDLLGRDLLSNAPGMPGMTHGFMVVREANPRLIGHSGNTVDFHSQLLLAPELDFGFFISMTGGQGSHAARTDLANALIGRLFPQEPMPRWTRPGSKPATGAYRINRRNYAKTAVAAEDLILSPQGDHGLLVVDHGQKSYWEQVGPSLYERVTDARRGGPYDRLLLYDVDGDHRLSFASQPHVAYHRTSPKDR